MHDGVGDRLGLVDRGDKLRLQAHLLARTVELGRVDRPGQDHRDVDARTLLLELDAGRLEERPQSSLRRARRSSRRRRA